MSTKEDDDKICWERYNLHKNGKNFALFIFEKTRGNLELEIIYENGYKAYYQDKGIFISPYIDILSEKYKIFKTGWNAAKSEDELTYEDFYKLN